MIDALLNGFFMALRLAQLDDEWWGFLIPIFFGDLWPARLASSSLFLITALNHARVYGFLNIEFSGGSSYRVFGVFKYRVSGIYDPLAQPGPNYSNCYFESHSHLWLSKYWVLGGSSCRIFGGFKYWISGIYGPLAQPALNYSRCYFESHSHLWFSKYWVFGGFNYPIFGVFNYPIFGDSKYQISGIYSTFFVQFSIMRFQWIVQLTLQFREFYTALSGILNTEFPGVFDSGGFLTLFVDRTLELKMDKDNYNWCRCCWYNIRIPEADWLLPEGIQMSTSDKSPPLGSWTLPALMNQLIISIRFDAFSINSFPQLITIPENWEFKSPEAPS